jgi:hypothetical protein
MGNNVDLIAVQITEDANHDPVAEFTRGHLPNTACLGLHLS